MVLDWYKLEGTPGKIWNATGRLNMRIVVDDVGELPLILLVINFIRYYYLKETVLIF